MTELRNIHPGEILMEEFLKPLDLSQNKIARDIKVPPRRINEIVKGIRSITADTDLRLSKYFGTSEGFWMRLQDSYELLETKRKLKDQIKTIPVCDRSETQLSY
jgi:addiction module HigA family antidote